MLVHEGAPSTNCDDDGRLRHGWGDIVNNVSPDVDAIVSGHTHLAYDCSFPVAAWATRVGRSPNVRSSPPVSTARTSTSWSSPSTASTGEVSAKSQTILPLATARPTRPTPTSPASSDGRGRRRRARARSRSARSAARSTVRSSADTAPTENRGGESTLGNLVAEVQRWATEAPESGAAEIAFMNPGGLRADMAGTGTGPLPAHAHLSSRRPLVQPFANTLVNMDLTGAQIKTVLEQQWQPRDSLNRLLTRPFLRLGVSEGFEYTYSERIVTEFPLDNPATPDVDESLTSYQGRYGTVTGMWLNGVPIDPAATYSVTVNSFLATGGDNFLELNNGAGKRDTGKIDLTAMVDYMAEFAEGRRRFRSTTSSTPWRSTSPPVLRPRTFPTPTVTFDVKSWAMSTAADVKDSDRGRVARRHRARDASPSTTRSARRSTTTTARRPFRSSCRPALRSARTS